MIRDALGYGGLKPNGSYYDSMGTAVYQVESAGEKLVELIPDGITDIPKVRRMGLYPDVFERVLAHKEKRAADRDVREQKSWDDAQAQKDAFDQQKADELAERIAQQDAARAQRAAEQSERYEQLDAARDAEIQRLIAEDEAKRAEVQQSSKAGEEAVILWMMTYDGPLNRKGFPKNDVILAATGVRMKGRKQRLWAAAQERKAING